MNYDTCPSCHQSGLECSRTSCGAIEAESFEDSQADLGDMFSDMERDDEEAA